MATYGEMRIKDAVHCGFHPVPTMVSLAPTNWATHTTKKCLFQNSYKLETNPYLAFSNFQYNSMFSNRNPNSGKEKKTVLLIVKNKYYRKDPL
jgi:hypothetical protein